MRFWNLMLLVYFLDTSNSFSTLILPGAIIPFKPKAQKWCASSPKTEKSSSLLFYFYMPWLGSQLEDLVWPELVQLSEYCHIKQRFLLLGFINSVWQKNSGTRFDPSKTEKEGGGVDGSARPCHSVERQEHVQYDLCFPIPTASRSHPPVWTQRNCSMWQTKCQSFSPNPPNIILDHYSQLLYPILFLIKRYIKQAMCHQDKQASLSLGKVQCLVVQCV